jgi:hypothetical protein
MTGEQCRGRTLRSSVKLSSANDAVDDVGRHEPLGERHRLGLEIGEEPLLEMTAGSGALDGGGGSNACERYLAAAALLRQTVKLAGDDGRDLRITTCRLMV